jgi:hypothetical protein
LRIAEYAKIAYERNGPLASQLVNAMLQNTLKMGKSFKILNSEKMTLE